MQDPEGRGQRATRRYRYWLLDSLIVECGLRIDERCKAQGTRHRAMSQVVN